MAFAVLRTLSSGLRGSSHYARSRTQFIEVAEAAQAQRSGACGPELVASTNIRAMQH